MRKFIAVSSLVFVFFVCSAFSPAGGTWLDVTTSELGSVRLYINHSYYDGYFSLDEAGLPVSVYSSQINAYILNSAGERYYTVTISPYGETWFYRSYNQSSTYNRSLTVTGVSVDTSTVSFMGLDIPESPDMMLYLLIFFAGAILLGVWRCARK